MVLMLHLMNISMGAVNVDVAYNVLGLCERVDKERYLLGVRTGWKAANMLSVCDERKRHTQFEVSYHTLTATQLLVIVYFPVWLAWHQHVSGS